LIYKKYSIVTTFISILYRLNRTLFQEYIHDIKSFYGHKYVKIVTHAYRKWHAETLQFQKEMSYSRKDYAMSMSREHYTMLVHRFFDDVFTREDRAAAEEILTPDFTFYGPPEGIHGIPAFFELTRTIREALNVQFKVEVVIIEDEATVSSLTTMRGKHEKVVFRGVPPKGGSFEVPRIDNFIIEGGKIKEVNAVLDHQMLMECLRSPEKSKQEHHAPTLARS
jgi:predicted ester cyclase